MQQADHRDGDRPPRKAATGRAVGEATLAEPAQFRMVLVSFLGAAIGLLAGCIAFLLYKLIGLFTNLAFYGRFVADFSSARHNHLGFWVIPIPLIGGIIVGLMAKYRTPKIKGHGIPEAMEAVLIHRSRIEPRGLPSSSLFRQPLPSVREVRSAPKAPSSKPVARWARWCVRYSIPRAQSARCCWLVAPRRAWPRPSTLPSRV
jgi:hypothetical protein